MSAAPRILQVVIVSLGVVDASLFCASARFSSAAVVAFTAICLCFVLSASKSSGEQIATGCAALMLLWFTASPVASFYLRHPLERSLMTFDRILFAAIILSLLARRYGSGQFRSGGVRFSATSFEIIWALFVAVALVSVVSKSTNIGFAARIAVDSLALPLAAFYLARRHFDAERFGRALLASAMLLAFVLFATGLYEYVTGINLFQYKGSELTRAGELRVNGPFSSDSSFAIISLLAALFVRAAPKMFNIKLDQGARLVWLAALGCAVAASLMPLYRAAGISLAISWAIYEVCAAGLPWERALRASQTVVPNTSAALREPRVAARRFAVLFAAGMTAAAILFVAGTVVADSSSIAARLVNPRNLFSRVVSWQASARMALDSPVLGVGLWNFTEVFERQYSEENFSAERALNTRIAVGPHSNLVWVATELGFAGFAPYVAANVLLLLIGWRALGRARAAETRARAACFIALFAAYWIPGLVLASGAYSDLNLCFFFLLGLLSRPLLASASE